MKILLSTLNSKYIHSNLAIRYLKAYSSYENIEISEYTINDNLNNIISDIYLKCPDVIAFSCYIWNIENTLKVASSLKRANPSIKIILGGPEVSYNPKEILKNNLEIDFIIMGEGEVTFDSLINNVHSDLSEIDGLVYRENENIIVNRPRKLIENLDAIPFPYDDLENFKGKMAYYESSRGCPFSCQYCLSSTIEGVRFFSMDRVKEDLDKLISVGVSQVKFIDRSFNCNKSRTKEIFKYLIEINPKINFHFEINADLIDDEILEILEFAPEGLFQFEIGVQSTNSKTVKEISRVTDFEKLSKVVNRINSYKNIHLHLDLIAGLPYESYEEFMVSFNDVYALKPQMFQLGFLKMLKGSAIRINANKYKIQYNEYAPYEVISTNDISYDKIIKLKDLEDILDKYYNSKRFYKSINYITENLYETPFKLYEDFSGYWRKNDLFKMSHSSKKLYSILMGFIMNYHKDHELIINELLKYDYLCNHKNFILPNNISRENYEIRPQIFEFLKDEQNVNKYLKRYIGKSAKEIIKQVHVEVFEYNILSEEIKKERTVILFEYLDEQKTFKNANTYNISEYFKL